MDKLIEQLFKAFNHIAREVQIYFTSGTLILLNIYVVDYFYYDSSLWNIVKQSSFMIPLLIVSYVLGHFSMSFYYVLIEMTHLDKKIRQWLDLKTVEEHLQPRIFSQHPDLYKHFIERHDLLSMMRWNISAALCINFIIGIIWFIVVASKWQVCLLAIICIVCSILLLFLSLKSEHDLADRINWIRELPGAKYELKINE